MIRSKMACLFAVAGMILGLTPLSSSAGDIVSSQPTWTKIGVPPAPDPRIEMSMVWADELGTLIVFGGLTTHGRDSDIWMIRPFEEHPHWSTFDPGAVAPAPRQSSSAIWDPENDQVVIYGGYGGPSGRQYGDVWALPFDGAGRPTAWVQLAPNPANETADAGPGVRWGHTAVYDSNWDAMVIHGGTNLLANSLKVVTGQPQVPREFGGGYGLSDMWAFSLTGSPGLVPTSRWSSIEPVGPRLAFHSASRIPSGHFVTIEGDNDKTRVWSYDLASSLATGWRQLSMKGSIPTKPPITIGTGYSTTLDGILALVHWENGEDVLYRVGISDEEAIWSRVASLPSDTIARGAATTIIRDGDGHEQFVAFGGDLGLTERGNTGTADLVQFDLETQGWSEVSARPNLLPSFWGDGVMDESRGLFYVFGGEVAGEQDRRPHADWRLDLATGRWKPLPPRTVPTTNWAVMDPETHGLISQEGCNGGVSMLHAAASSWTELATTGAPPPVCDPEAIWDPVRRRVILLGGLTIDDAGHLVGGNRTVYALELGEAPARWHVVPTPGSVMRGVASDDVQAAYDPMGDRILQFNHDAVGGEDEGSETVVQELTFESDGTARWADLEFAGTPPSARWGSSVVMDTRNQQLIVWSGFDGGTSVDGGADPTLYALRLTGAPTWGTIPVQGQPPRGRVLAAHGYDSRTGSLILFGGCFSDCWGSDSEHRQLSRDAYAVNLVAAA